MSETPSNDRVPICGTKGATVSRALWDEAWLEYGKQYGYTESQHARLLREGFYADELDTLRPGWRPVDQRIAALERELAAANEARERALAWTDEDKPIPEDAEIHKHHPVVNGSHKTYEKALRMVGAKRSKGALVDLVNWLLQRADEAEEALSETGEALAVEVTARGAAERDRDEWKRRAGENQTDAERYRARRYCEWCDYDEYCVSVMPRDGSATRENFDEFNKNYDENSDGMVEDCKDIDALKQEPKP